MRHTEYSVLWKDFYRNRLIVGLWIGIVLVHVSFLLLYHLKLNWLKWLTVEDGPFEDLQALMYLAASFLFVYAIRNARGWSMFWAIIFACGFFLMFAEEISWGQRIFGYNVSAVEKINRQGEFNIHNLPVLADYSLMNTSRLLTLGSLCFGVLLPCLLTISPWGNRLLLQRFRLPVPHPVVAVCFVLSYLWYRSYHPGAAFPILVEESRETSLALGFLLFAALWPMVDKSLHNNIVTVEE